MRYFFDLREGDRVIPDEEGMDLGTLQEVEEEAARSLADMARDNALEHRGDGVDHSVAIEVRDEYGPVLEARFVVELGHTKH